MRSIPQFGVERSSLDLGRPFVPLNTLVVYRPSVREPVGRRLWLGGEDGQGFNPLSLVFTQAPLRTGLQACIAFAISNLT